MKKPDIFSRRYQAQIPVLETMAEHFTMFNYMLKTCEEQLSKKLIKEYHYRLKAGVFEDIANGYPIGEYKNRRNMVSDITTSEPEAVEADMQALLENYKRKSEYYECLNNARLKGEYEPLIGFFRQEQERYSEMVKYFICPVAKGMTAEREQNR